MRLFLLLSLLVTVLFVREFRVGAAEPKPFTAQELEEAVKLARESDEAKTTAATLAGLAKPYKQFLIDVKPAESSRPGMEARLAVVVTHQYMKQGPGLTMRSTVDLNAKKVIKHEVLANYPTPLAKEELETAIKLARANVAIVEALYAAAGGKVTAQHLVTIVANPQDPAYGHRLVYLFIEVDGRPVLPGPVLVDLTAEQAKLIGPTTNN